MAQKILELVEWLDRWFFRKVNVLSAFSATLTDTKVPSEKLVKNSLDGKVDKINGKGLSTNDYDNISKAKVDNLKNVATTGSYNDLIDKPTIGDQVHIDIDSTLDANSSNPVANNALVTEFNNKANINHTHSYNDLTNKPEISGNGQIVNIDFGFDQETQEIYLNFEGE